MQHATQPIPYRLTLTAIVAYLALAAAPATAGPIDFGNQTFSSESQSIWSSGGAFQFEFDEFLGVEWNNVGIDLGTGIKGDKKKCIGVKKFGKCLDVKTDTRRGFELEIETSGEVGIRTQFEVDSGSIDTSATYSISANPADSVTSGSFFSLNTAQSLNAGSFETTSPNLFARLRAIVDLEAEADAEACIYAFGCSSGSSKIVNIDEKIDIVEFDTSQDLNVHLFDDSAVLDLEQFKEIEIAGGLAELEFGIPPNVATTGALDGNKIKGSGSDDLVSAKLDLDGVLTSLGLLPPLDFEKSVGPVDIELTALDADAGPVIELFQDIRVKPKLVVDLAFTDASGDELFIDVEGSSTPVSSWSGEWDDVPDFAITEETTFTPTFSAESRMRNTTGADFNLELDLEMLSAEAEISIGPATVELGSFGPVFEKSFDTTLFSVDVFDGQFDLGGWESIQGTPFTVGVAVSSDTPVVYADGEEKGGLTLTDDPVRLQVDTGDTAHQKGAISESPADSGFGVRKIGGGTLQMSADNTYTGQTRINSGVIQLLEDSDSPGSNENNKSLDDTTVKLAVSNGLDLNGLDKVQLGGLTGGGDLDLGSSALVVGLNDEDTKYGGDLSGDGRLNKVGDGTLQLRGNNQQAQLRAGAGVVDVKEASSLAGTLVIFDGGEVHFNGGDIEAVSDLGLQIGDDGGTLRADKDVVWNGNIFDSPAASDPGQLTLTGAEDSTITLSGNNSYSGGTTIDGPVIVAATSTAFGTGDVTVLGSRIDFGDGVVIENDIELRSESRFRVADGEAAEQAGVISSVGTPNLIKTGGGTLTLSGINTYTGRTIFNNGTLSVSQDANLGDGGALRFIGGELEATSSFTTTRDIILGVQGAKFDMLDGVTLTLDTEITTTANSNLVKFGEGTLVFAEGNVNSHARMRIQEGVLEVFDDNQLGATGGLLTLNGGTVRFRGDTTSSRKITVRGAGGQIDVDDGHTVTWDDEVDGSGVLTKGGDGTLVLSANNSMKALVVDAGIAEMTDHQGIGASGASLTLRGARARFTSSFTSDDNELRVGSEGGAFAVTDGNTVTWNGGVSDDGDPGTLTKRGNGTWIVGGENGFSGTLRTRNGLLRLGNALAFQHADVVLSAGQAGEGLDINGFDAVLGSLATDGNGNIELGSNTLTVGLNGNDTDFQGTVFGDASSMFVKDGAGTMTFGADLDDYFGTFEVAGGTFVWEASSLAGTIYDVTVGAEGAFVNNSTLADVNLTVSGLLSGSGGASVTVADGGFLAPGDSPGTMVVDELIWQDGGEYLWEINDVTGTAGNDPGWDKIEVNGAWDISGLSLGGFTIDIISLEPDNDVGPLANFDWMDVYSFEIMSFDSLIGTFSQDLFILDTGFFLNPFQGFWSLSVSGNSLWLTYTFDSQADVTLPAIIPEPSAMSLMLIGLLLLFRRPLTARIARRR